MVALEHHNRALHKEAWEQKEEEQKKLRDALQGRRVAIF